MLLGLGDPVVETSPFGCVAGPVLVLRACRRVDDAGDMAGAGQHEVHRPAEEFRAEEHRLRRRDVVLARREIVDRDRHLAEVERARRRSPSCPWRACSRDSSCADRRSGWPPACGSNRNSSRAGRTGSGCLALEVVVDDVGPDQVVRAQHVEGVRHLACLRDSRARPSASRRAAICSSSTNTLRSPAWVKSTCVVKKVARRDAVVALRRHVGERDREQRAADAIADGVDLASRRSPARSTSSAASRPSRM